MAHDEERDTIIKELEDLFGKWDAELTRSEHHLDQIAAGAQPQIDPHVAARVDKDGVITKLTIDSHAFTEYTTEELSQVITRSLQAVFDDIDAKVRKVTEVAEPDRAAEPRIVIKATHDSGITVAVDRWFRPLYCNIEPRAIAEYAEAMPPDGLENKNFQRIILSHRIERLCRLAQLRIKHQIKSVFASPAVPTTSSWSSWPSVFAAPPAELTVPPADLADVSTWLAQDAHYEFLWPGAKVSVHAEPPPSDSAV